MAVAATAVYLIGGILWVIIRNKKIERATQTGFVNKYGQVNCECTTPDWRYEK